MLRGVVTFRAALKGNGLKFDLLEYDPREHDVEKVEVEGPTGKEIRVTVCLASVATREAGHAIAVKVSTATLDRIAFAHDVAIEKVQHVEAHFSPLIPQPGVVTLDPLTLTATGQVAWLVRGLVPGHLKTELEQAALPGEQYFGLLRSARQSASPVEEFVHLYHILLMLLGDSQAAVDRFIVSEDPAIPQTQYRHPKKAKSVLETIYTRLRNELAHRRAGVNLEDTKAEMASRLPGLIALTKRAIEMSPDEQF